MRNKLNKLSIGLVLGLILPIIILFIVYNASYNAMTFSEFVKYTEEFDLFTKIVSICVLPNLGLFFLFIKRNMLMGARGVLFSVIVYLIFIAIYKVV
ncbi:MAG: hypothetical protein JXR58_07505 [Bacteroidales bacterium]|nr:hypothetical protein [Bacteroidales bacterium]